MKQRRLCQSTALHLLGLLVVLPAVGYADLQPIVIDGFFDDWAGIPPAHVDPVGDGAARDLGRLWLADDHDYLFLCFEISPEHDLSEDANLELFLDADCDAATGLAAHGLGAELHYRFGRRFGQFYGPLGNWPIDHADIGLRCEPTVTSERFEVGIDLAALPNGADPLFAGDCNGDGFVDTYDIDAFMALIGAAAGD